MPDVLMGQRVKELVRRYFMEGNKSSNKAYYADLGGNVASPTAKATKRNKAQDTAEYVLGQVREQFSGRSQDGRALWLLKELGADVRAGNCYEMSILAAHMVLRYEHVPQSRIYICSIGAPGDHVFCLVSDANITERTATTLYGFTRVQPDHLIIDPWLNVACWSRLYIRETIKRLKKWQAEGKRVLWLGPDGKEKGWYPPADEYMQAMQRSPVTLSPFEVTRSSDW